MSNAAGSPRRPVIVISLITAACLLGDSMLYIVLPLHWKEAGLTSLWEVGILLSVNRVIRLPLNPLVGWIYKKISSFSGVMLALMLAVCTTFSYGFAKGFALWFALRCIWGIAWTFLRLGGFYTVLDAASENNRGHFMGLYNGLYRLGSLGGMLIGGIMADIYGIGITSVLFGTATMLAIPFAYALITDSKVHEEVEKPAPAFSIKLNSDICWTLLTGLTIAMIYQGVFTATLSHLVQAHISPTVNIFTGIIGAASVAGILQALRWGWEPWLAPRFGRISDGRFGRKTMLAVTMLTAALLFSLISLNMPTMLWLLLILSILLTATILTTLADTVACDVAFYAPPKTFMTVYSFSIDLGAAMGPVIGYTLNAVWGPYAVYWCMALILFCLGIKWIARPISIYSPNCTGRNPDCA